MRYAKIQYIATKPWFFFLSCSYDGSIKYIYTVLSHPRERLALGPTAHCMSIPRRRPGPDVIDDVTR